MDEPKNNVHIFQSDIFCHNFYILSVLEFETYFDLRGRYYQAGELISSTLRKKIFRFFFWFVFDTQHYFLEHKNAPNEQTGILG